MRTFSRHVKPSIAGTRIEALRVARLPTTQAARRASSVNSGINQGLRKTEQWDKRGGSKPRASAPSSRPPSKRDDREVQTRDKSRQKPGPPAKEQDATTQQDTEHRKRRNTMPVSIPYTTAASQFFSGTRIILSLLLGSKRQLYNLYISRELDSNVVTDLQAQARKRKVTFHMRTRDEISAMEQSVVDKDHRTRSALLECSPPVEPPITSLHAIHNPNERELRVTLAPQSREDAAINGTSGTVALNPLAKNTPPRYPFLLWLHGVKNTGNLGALYRSAAYFGVDAVLLSARATASLNAGVVSTARGAADAVPSFRVRDPAAFMASSQARGWTFAAAVVDAARAPRPLRRDAPGGNPLLAGPTVAVLGDEQGGLPGAFVAGADALVSVPGQSAAARRVGLDSLNVSVAGALLVERLLRPGRAVLMDEDEGSQLVTWMEQQEYWGSEVLKHEETMAGEGMAQSELRTDHEEQAHRPKFWD